MMDGVLSSSFFSSVCVCAGANTSPVARQMVGDDCLGNVPLIVFWEIFKKWLHPFVYNESIAQTEIKDKQSQCLIFGTIFRFRNEWRCVASYVEKRGWGPKTCRECSSEEAWMMEAWMMGIQWVHPESRLVQDWNKLVSSGAIIK